jgi:uncharacterized protein (DUF1330 family)
MFQSYRDVVIPQLIEFGCEFTVVNDDVERAEGSPDPTIVILKFESMDALKKWYESPEYQPIKKLRTNSTEGWVAFSEEFVMPG